MGERGAVGDEVADFVLMGPVAEGVDGGKRLSAQFSRKEDGGNDECEDDHDERDGGAEGWVFDFGAEPVIGALGDDGEDDGSDDADEEGLEHESAEDEDAKGEEEEGDLLPVCFRAAVGHQAIAPLSVMEGRGMFLPSHSTAHLPI